MIPPRALSFQHRAEVDQLRTAADGGGTAVLTGTGGVGKTQLAADHARNAWDNGSVDVLVWITASSRSEITDGYAQAGVEVLGADPTDPERAAREFLAWLEPKATLKPCRWLVVLDDLAAPADLRDLWPPSSPRGRTLVTSRRRDAALTGAGRCLVRVGLFRPWESAAYLTEMLAAHGRAEPADQINGLATDLGHLPLALAQAAAYVIDATLACADYRQLLADRMRKLADLLPEPGTLPDDQATTVAATWSLSIERADQLRPAGLARPMLQLAAMLDPNGIPSTVLASPPVLTYLAEFRIGASLGQTHTQQVTGQDAVGALSALQRLNLIEHSPNVPHRAVQVHQLIQRAARDAMPAADRDVAGIAAATALIAAWPETERDTALAQALRANTEALTRHAEDSLYQLGDFDDELDGVHPVLFRTGESLGEAGQIDAAIKHMQHVLDTAGAHLGRDHADTLHAAHDLAHWLGESGDFAGAASAYKRLLKQETRALGCKHTTTLDTGVSLAYWLMKSGDAVGAASTYKRLLKPMTQARGPDHPHVLNLRHNLAWCQGEAGDAVGAAAALERLLEQELQVLGSEDPLTLNTLGALARWRGEVGDHAGAVAALESVVDQKLRVIGPDHPDTLSARHSLGRWRAIAGDIAGATADLENLLVDRLRVLGPDHPHTFATRSNLANLRGRAGDPVGAAEATAELLGQMLRVLGADHPHTVRTRDALAYWRTKAVKDPAAQQSTD
ncbi:tetratricopeptide repeat protein [Streptomyces broussonetiae]|uniref:Tetratricopeptide repeat protein n=1 Tax=Streptomyces broussonetiae TaxID=2686304 RepID=A0A6I6NMF8_9ACTN|nr:tetratricopeptide repeat protein [Streptomyces broussonetiae]